MPYEKNLPLLHYERFLHFARGGTKKKVEWHEVLCVPIHFSSNMLWMNDGNTGVLRSMTKEGV